MCFVYERLDHLMPYPACVGRAKRDLFVYLHRLPQAISPKFDIIIIYHNADIILIFAFLSDMGIYIYIYIYETRCNQR